MADITTKVPTAKIGVVYTPDNDAEGAQLRHRYIQGLQKAAPIFGTEYAYLDGPVLVRVSGKLNPTQTAK